MAAQQDTALISARPGGSAPCVVRRIIDGDTFQCEGGSRVRLLIADALERGQGAYADSAALLLERLMPAGTGVRLELDVQVQDRTPAPARVRVCRRRLRESRPRAAGLWSGSAFECSPADYRAGRCR